MKLLAVVKNPASSAQPGLGPSPATWLRRASSPRCPAVRRPGFRPTGRAKCSGDRRSVTRTREGTTAATTSAQPALGARGGVTNGRENAGCTPGQRSLRAAKVRRAGSIRGGNPDLPPRPPLRVNRAPAPDAGARTDRQIALVSPTLFARRQRLERRPVFRRCATRRFQAESTFTPLMRG